MLSGTVIYLADIMMKPTVGHIMLDFRESNSDAEMPNEDRLWYTNCKHVNSRPRPSYSCIFTSELLGNEQLICV